MAISSVELNKKIIMPNQRSIKLVEMRVENEGKKKKQQHQNGFTKNGYFC